MRVSIKYKADSEAFAEDWKAAHVYVLNFALMAVSVCPDGLSITPIRDSAGNIVGAVGVSK